MSNANKAPKTMMMSDKDLCEYVTKKAVKKLEKIQKENDGKS